MPLLPADYVTEDAGTGFVHTAPGHGEDDFALGVRHGIEVPRTLDDEGVFYPSVALVRPAQRVLYTQGQAGRRQPDLDRRGYCVQAGKRLLANGKITSIPIRIHGGRKRR